MELRIIKTEEQYRRYLAEVEALAAHDPDPDSSDGARLELLAKLVEDYEKSQFPFKRPDPVDAILFRMEQQGLRQKDIADILGGKNRASEILARKRPLTLSMIRALYENLDIPPALLIAPPAPPSDDSDEFDVGEGAADLLVTRRWVPSTEDAKAWLQRLLAPIGSPAYLKHTLTVGVSKRTNRTNLWLWLARVREIADSRTHLHGRYRKGNLNEESMRYLVRLSWMERGPQLAKEFLEEKGIALVIEPHLPNTWLDGAAMLGRHGLPIIGMTLREDRLDNFWFTLVHECIHVSKHLDTSGFRAIADEHIEKPDTDTVEIEKEANSLAAEILLPRGVWRRSAAYLNPSTESIQQLAEKLQVHPAIVAGRLRFERKNYALFTKLVGLHQARICFPEIRWS
ncbi:MAG TPA: ImmA/IrrE family metallo-endopeptidase [Steroidobacteraceae bacterium]|nr:ImmA/IrrE family metallo-endopeptidase [Steroidobacteraceae bacterium]